MSNKVWCHFSIWNGRDQRFYKGTIAEDTFNDLINGFSVENENKFIKLDDLCWIGSDGTIEWLSNCKSNGTSEGYTNTMFIKVKQLMEIRPLDTSFQTVLLEKGSI